MMIRLLPHLAIPLATSLALSVGCASTDSEPNKPPVKVPETPPADDGAPPETKPNATVAIASVQVIEDCPHQDKNDLPALPAGSPAAPEPPAADEDVPARPARSMTETAAGAARRGGGDIDSCTQSTVQLAFTGTTETPAAVRIVGTRLLRPDTNAKVGTLNVRKPKQWIDGSGYRPWDQTVPAGGSLKASYKLSMPNWAEVDKDIGKSSFGYMFILEVDVEIDGAVQTLTSPQFPREEPHVVVT